MLQRLSPPPQIRGRNPLSEHHLLRLIAGESRNLATRLELAEFYALPIGAEPPLGAVRIWDPRTAGQFRVSAAGERQERDCKYRKSTHAGSPSRERQPS